MPRVPILIRLTEEVVQMSIFDSYQKRFEQHLQEEYTLQEYLDLCKQEPLVYATAAERMLEAIGEPELVDTSQDTLLSRIFSNKVIARYPAFSEFYGMEEAIEQSNGVILGLSVFQTSIGVFSLMLAAIGLAAALAPSTTPPPRCDGRVPSGPMVSAGLPRSDLNRVCRGAPS